MYPQCLFFIQNNTVSRNVISKIINVEEFVIIYVHIEMFCQLILTLSHNERIPLAAVFGELLGGSGNTATHGFINKLK